MVKKKDAKNERIGRQFNQISVDTITATSGTIKHKLEKFTIPVCSL